MFNVLFVGLVTSAVTQKLAHCSKLIARREKTVSHDKLELALDKSITLLNSKLLLGDSIRTIDKLP